MHTPPSLRALAGAALIALLAAGAAHAQTQEPILPLPRSLHVDPARAALGQRLFTEVRLSGNERVSCASCHSLTHGGTDGQARSPGLAGTATRVNTPTVLNAAFNFRQFWNGRAATLEDQVGEVVENPVEMGAHWPEVLRKLAAIDSYRRQFGAIYRDGITRANVADAIASYERTLITPDAPFDRYLRGDANAITADEKAGYQRFKQYGCVACHQGVNVGGNMFQKFGAMVNYLQRPGMPLRPGDEGRFAVTGNPADRQVFKVPSLRNVALTAPYFHDASARTLEQAIDVMFQYQLGRAGTPEDKALIAKFLHTLTAPLAQQP